MTLTTVFPCSSRMALLLRRATEACWLAVAGLLPLFFLGNVMRPFYPPKSMLLQFLVVVMLAMLAARWLIEGRGGTVTDVRGFLRNRMHLAALVFALIAVVATVMSLSPALSIVGSVNRRQGLLTILSWIAVFLVIATQLRTYSQLRRLILTVLASSGLVSIIGIVEHYVPAFSSWFLSTTYTPRVASTTGNQLSLSAYLAMAIPFTLASGVFIWMHRGQLARSRAMLAAIAVLLALQAWCLVLSIYSFVLFLYLVPGALFMAVFALLLLQRRSVTFAALAVLAAVVVAGAAIVLPQWRNAVEGTSPYPPGTPLPADTEERLHGTLYGRARYWVYALDVLPQSVSNPQPGDSAPVLRPLIGYGPETYFLSTQRHIPPEYRTAQIQGASFRDRPHNHFMYLALTTGILGLAAWLVLVVGCGMVLYRLLRKTGPPLASTLFGLAAGCAVAGFLAHAVFNPIAITEEGLLWTSFALIPAIASLRGTPAPANGAGTGAGATCTSSSRLRTFIACILVVGAVVGGILAVRNPILGEKALRDAVMMSGADNPNAVFMYSRATELQPMEPSYWGALGGYAHSVALTAPDETKATVLELSHIALRQARDHEPLFAFWHYQLGDSLLYAHSSINMVPLDNALESYHRALELYPNNAVLSGRVALTHMVGGDYDAAAAALQRSSEYDPNWSRTPHLKAALTALDGRGDVATQSLIAHIHVSPRELRTFTQLAAEQLHTYALLDRVADEMLPYLDEGGEDYAALALRGAVLALTHKPDEAAPLLSAAITMAPEDAATQIMNTADYLAGLVPGLRQALATSQAALCLCPPYA